MARKFPKPFRVGKHILKVNELAQIVKLQPALPRPLEAKLRRGGKLIMRVQVQRVGAQVKRLSQGQV